VDYRDCPYCSGTGRDPSILKPKPCPVCNGTGRLRAFPEDQVVECRFCRGTGKSWDPDTYRTVPCPVCHGQGVISAGPIEFLAYVSGRKPYTDRRTIEDILEQVSGKVRICETYLGKGTLDLLRSIPATCSVRVLVGKITRDVSPQEVNCFRQEHPSFEFRHHTQRELHDRYLIDDRGLLIFGHGLKDIGKRESFVIFLEKSLIPDLIRDVLRAFDDRWESATPIEEI